MNIGKYRDVSVSGLLLVSALFAFAGCKTTDQAKNPTPSRAPMRSGSQIPAATAPVVAPSPFIDKLMLMVAPPSAINWDEKPGPDGVRVKIYLFQGNGAKGAIGLKKGTIELMLFDGRITIGQIDEAVPTHRWRYTAAQLKGALNKTQGGYAYGLALPFEQKVPQKDIITVWARIPRPEGGPIRSRPVHLTMTPR